MTITAHGPISRHITEYLTDERVRHYRCKTLQNPDYYFDGRVFGAVDVAHKLDTSTEKAGGLWLRNKAIVSVGTKKADDAYKLFGLRPDDDQSGNVSVEWSIESIEINGQQQTINLRDRLEVSPITTKFGDNLYVQRARQRCRIMVPGDANTESFKISLVLHLKGCTVEYRESLDEYWIYRGGTFFCRLGKPYLVDMDMNPILGDFVKHSLVEIGKGEYRYTKEATAAFALVDLPASYLIDADTVYSTTADGWVSNSGTTWSTVRNATDGDNSDYGTSSSSSESFLARKSSVTYYIARSFFTHVTSGVSGTISSVVQNVYGYYYNTTTICTQLGTQDSSINEPDYDAFSGNYFGSVLWAKNAYNQITFNAAGIAAINQTGNTLLCSRDYNCDYSDVTPTLDRANGCYYTNASGTDKDPYLYITTAAAAAKGALLHYRRLRA